MSQRARQNNTTLMSQPPISNSERNQLPSPPSNNFPQSSRNSDSERTISASPNDVPSPPTSPSNMPIVRPIGNNLFEPWRANKVIDYVTKIFPDAIKSYNDAPIHMKDVWFNEFRVTYFITAISKLLYNYHRELLIYTFNNLYLYKLLYTYFMLQML
ncbi:PREDICTED: uncharacterized protein LOC109160641 [Ipomoea nil]|uniref:uncharacterized protein LOC109160641 n=1 Tax=Ipomoea nil TaxID=35883 RepID=UPI000901535C|nr:PREDICTED: uncharacterized protein LOC109160641 [Ipomoea nil]